MTQLAPSSPDAQINLGWLLSQQGKDDEAVACYNRALAADRNSVGAIAGLAERRCQQSRWSDAVKLYERILQLDANSADALASLGIALRELGDISGAIARLEVAIFSNHHYCYWLKFPNREGFSHNDKNGAIQL